MPLVHSSLSTLTDPNTFLWSTGIEDTFVTAPWPKTGRTLDEYELTGHYQSWREDLDLIAKLGVKSARYGVPWHRIQPSRHSWDWSFADATLERLLELGIDPIVDLVHYGLPPWIDDAYLNPDFPKYMAEYSTRLAERFLGRIHCYTPLNEPRVTAWYCGKLGWWPPFRKGWPGFLAVLVGACRGIVETIHALKNLDPEIVPVHVDATDLYDTNDPALVPDAEQRQEIVFLAIDLILGRVTATHRLWPWMIHHGVKTQELEWFAEHAVELPLIGINLYPLFSGKVLVNSGPGRRLRIKMPYAGAEIIDRLAELYWDRYRTPLIISETASLGSVRRRKQWLEDSVAAVGRVRQRGIPLVGYTWWPLFALVTWAYRQGHHPPAYYLKQMGLWDLQPGPDGSLLRIKTPLVEAYQNLVAGGHLAVGELEPEERFEHVS